MKNLNQEDHYKRDLFHVAINDEIGDDWFILWTSGNSSEDQNDYAIATRHLHAGEIPNEVTDSRDTAELIVKLLNLYYRGFLFQGDPNQKELWVVK